MVLVESIENPSGLQHTRNGEQVSESSSAVTCGTQCRHKRTPVIDHRTMRSRSNPTDIMLPFAAVHRHPMRINVTENSEELLW